MVDLGLQQHTISAEWQGIAQAAEQIRVLFKARREAKPALESAVTRLSALIDAMDATLVRITTIQERIDAVEADVAEVGLENAAARLAALADMRNQVLYQRTIVLAHREQAMDLMIQVNPEDAWVWESENLDSLRRARAEIAAGHTTFYESGATFEAALTEIDAELEYRAHV